MEARAAKLLLLSSVITLGLLLVAVTAAFYIGKGCAPDPQPVDNVGIDAGPGERRIDEALDAAVVRAGEEIARLEREHAAEVARYDAEQRRRYEEVREQGPEAMAGWFTAFNLRLRDGGLRR